VDLALRCEHKAVDGFQPVRVGAVKRFLLHL
jgi:hypothetical protein